MNAEEMSLELRRRNLVELLYSTDDEDALDKIQNQIHEVDKELSVLRMRIYGGKIFGKKGGDQNRYDESY